MHEEFEGLRRPVHLIVLLEIQSTNCENPSHATYHIFDLCHEPLDIDDHS